VTCCDCATLPLETTNPTQGLLHNKSLCLLQLGKEKSVTVVPRALRTSSDKELPSRIQTYAWIKTFQKEKNHSQRQDFWSCSRAFCNCGRCSGLPSTFRDSLETQLPNTPGLKIVHSGLIMKFRSVQALKLGHLTVRFDFCTETLDKPANDLPAKLILSDEATYHINPLNTKRICFI
jgi:hypothetical protein